MTYCAKKELDTCRDVVHSEIKERMKKEMETLETKRGRRQPFFVLLRSEMSRKRHLFFVMSKKVTERRYGGGGLD